ncbi:hypothetical protein D3C76_1475460 [compost metagenome]
MESTISPGLQVNQGTATQNRNILTHANQSARQKVGRKWTKTGFHIFTAGSCGRLTKQA